MVIGRDYIQLTSAAQLRVNRAGLFSQGPSSWSMILAATPGYLRT